MSDEKKVEEEKGKDWFDTGYDGLDDAMKKERARWQPRFWLKEGEKRKIIFLDDEPLCFYEHHLKINGQWVIILPV